MYVFMSVYVCFEIKACESSLNFHHKKNPPPTIFLCFYNKAAYVVIHINQKEVIGVRSVNSKK
jgi:hypothetical protein